MPLVRCSGSRALCTGLLVVTITAVAVLLAPLAHAQTSAPAATNSAAELRAEADALSSRYFAALDRVQALDADIAHNQQVVDEMLARAKKARADARARALVAYTTSGTQLSTLVDSSNTLDTARRAHLIDGVNKRDEDVYTKLRVATRDVHKQQRVLRDTRAAQADALTHLRDQGATIDAKLAQAVQQEQAAQAAAAAAALPAAPAPSTTTAPSAAPAAAAAPPTTATPTTARPAPSAPAPPPAYSGTPGSSPHHDDPYLTCVRQRESGGNYGAVNPAGPYLGAYQFLQSTWNVTASHAGRSDLVGVPPNVASPYDQDEMAWALYQWQGTGPWGGSC
jgi:peptidoglycan hydrolase CwlO-like protein